MRRMSLTTRIVATRPLAAVLVTAWTAACGGPAASSSATTAPESPGLHPVRPTAGSPSEPAQPLAVATATPGQSDQLPPDLEAIRVQGIEAMDRGQFDEAIAAFRRVLELHPGNVATNGLLIAAEEAKLAHQRARSTELSNAKALQLARPPFAATLNEPTRAMPGLPPRLVKRSESRNQITDDKSWIQKHGITVNAWRGLTFDKKDPPSDVPTSFGGRRLIQMIEHPDHVVLIYGENFGSGRFLAVLDRDRKLQALLDFGAYAKAPNVLPGDESFVHQAPRWAQMQDGVLYVSHGHRTYAKSSGGKNAFISAIHVESGRLMWQSAPLVANALNFLLVDGHIITGYGFTAEPDFIFVLDQSTGKTVTKTPIKSGPSFFFLRDRKLFVRTYDTDYEFEVQR